MMNFGNGNTIENKQADSGDRISLLNQEIYKLEDDVRNYNKQFTAAQKNKIGTVQIRQMIENNIRDNIKKAQKQIELKEQEKKRLEIGSKENAPKQDIEELKKEVEKLEIAIEVCNNEIGKLQRKQDNTKSNDEFDRYSKEIEIQVHGRSLYEARRDALLDIIYP